jgi:S-adenosylmethionine decarboxylase proenzyme
MARFVWIALVLLSGNLFSQEIEVSPQATPAQTLAQTLDAPDHKFAGKHFLASYIGCDQKAMGDLEGIIQAMDRAVAASGATILDKTPFVFPPNGLTIVYLLSESHASLHTYPEYGACFVDLFTCGDICSPEGFDAALRDYLQPKEVNASVFLRSQTLEEAPYEVKAQ